MYDVYERNDGLSLKCPYHYFSNRTISENCVPFSRVFVQSHFTPHTLCPMGTVDGSMLNAGQGLLWPQPALSICRMYI